MADGTTQIRQRTASENKQVLVDAGVQQVAKVVPSWLRPYVEKAAPVIKGLAWVFDKTWPLVVKGYELSQVAYKFLEPHHPDLIFLMAAGLVLMMFGGYFVVTIACIEAFRISGWEATKKNLLLLYEDLKNVAQANAADDKVDDNNDGIPDVQQIPPSQLVSRKVSLFLATCNPEQLSTALTGIYAGCLGAIAALKIQFARTIALGASIGDVLSKPALKVLEPPIKALIPEKYHKWVPVLIRYACKSIGVSIAWQIQRVLSSVHSAIRGGYLFCDTFAIWTAKKGWMALSTGYWDEAFAVVCAAFGLYIQITSWFVLPWPLAILLFPFILIETLLTWFISFY